MTWKFGDKGTKKSSIFHLFPPIIWRNRCNRLRRNTLIQTHTKPPGAKYIVFSAQAFTKYRQCLIPGCRVFLFMLNGVYQRWKQKLVCWHLWHCRISHVGFEPKSISLPTKKTRSWQTIASPAPPRYLTRHQCLNWVFHWQETLLYYISSWPY